MKDCIFNSSKPVQNGKILGSHKESKKSIWWKVYAKLMKVESELKLSYIIVGGFL